MDTFALPPDLAARFQLRRVLGRGAMGIVLEAEDRNLGRLVALKRMYIEAGPVARERFLREARALARLAHPGVVAVLDVLEAENEMVLVTELLEGAPMDRLPDGTDPLGPMLDVAAALDAVHAAGLLHRDLKPANLYLTREGRGVILDFGLAFVDDRTRLTASGMVVGTPAFLAPEILRGQPAGPATDWYAWGASLYWLYEGRMPLGNSALHAILEGRPPEPEEILYEVLTPDHAARALVEATLDPDPARRPGSRKAAEALLGRRPRRRSRRPEGRLPRSPAAGPGERLAPRHGRGRLLGGVLGVGLVALAVAATLGRSPPPPPPLPVPPTPTPLPAEVARVIDAVDAELTRGLDLPPHPDPLLWLDVAGSRQGIQLAYRYLASNPDPLALPPEARRALEDLDGRLVSAGAPELFAPWLAVADLPDRFDVPVDTHYAPDALRGTRVTGPVARLAAAYQRTKARFVDLEAQIHGWDVLGGQIEGVPSELVPVALMGESGLRHLLETAALDPQRRRAAELWTWPASKLMRTLMIAGARLHATEPSDPALDSMPAVFVGARRALMMTGLAALPPEVLVPGVPRSAGAWQLRAGVLNGLVQARRSADRPWRELMVARLEALEEVERARAPRPPLTNNLSGRIDGLVQLGREREAQALVAQHLAVLANPRREGNLTDIVTALTPSWIRTRREEPTRRVVAAMLAACDAVPEEPTRRWFFKLRTTAKALREAFPDLARPGE